MQLIITVIFTSGRYHGRGEDKRLDRWPPSPSRLFQALIAGSHRGAYGLINQDIRDRALHWLERLDPPVINTCPVVESARGLKQFLPNNDDQINHVKSA
jgi:CRISPR-associated protein Csb2